jgi:hypothetical protein
LGDILSQPLPKITSTGKVWCVEVLFKYNDLDCWAVDDIYRGLLTVPSSQMDWRMWQVKLKTSIILSGNQINIIREFKDGWYYKKRISGCYTSHTVNSIVSETRREKKESIDQFSCV